MTEIIYNADYIELQHNPLKEQILIALKLTKEYISKNKLIITGGMAIDLALKTIGKQLYDDEEIPDYDCYSDEFITHANNLAIILCNEKLPNIGIVSAIHNTTLRVKMSGITVFDITYISTNIYKLLPTIEYLDLIIIDPNYQLIDIYQSLSFLFEITGSSFNILHRFEKDNKRNQLIINNFNIFINKEKINLKKKLIPLNIFNDGYDFNIYNQDKLISSFSDINNNNINYYYENENSYFETNKNICLNSFTTYSFYYTKMKLIINEFQNKYQEKINEQLDLFNNCIESDIIIIEHNNELFLESHIPSNTNLSFINNNNNINELLNILKKSFKYNNEKIDKYNRIIDNKPVSIIINNDIEILDLYGKLLSTNLTFLEFNKKKYNFIIANYNYVLSYFLINHYFNNNNNIYLSYYSSLLNIINISKLLYELDSNLFNNINQQKYNNSIFNYSISTFGKDNFPNSYFYFIKNFNYLYENKKNSNDKPNNNYLNPIECDIKNKLFELTKSPFFQNNGLLNNDMINTNYSNIIDNIISN
jgi:poly(A) polymerase-like protein